jgi:hypothetical protein
MQQQQQQQQQLQQLHVTEKRLLTKLSSNPLVFLWCYTCFCRICATSPSAVANKATYGGCLAVQVGTKQHTLHCGTVHDMQCQPMQVGSNAGCLMGWWC